MKGIKSAVTALLLWTSLVRPLNITRLEEACRVEDGFHRCSQRGRCRPRLEVALDCETARIRCTNDEVRCNVSRKCVPRHLIGTEKGCVLDDHNVRLPCRKDEFTCNSSGLCIPRNYVRNGLNDCNTSAIDDFSDELFALKECNLMEFRCQDEYERCIPREWVIDGHQDCFGGSDELRPLDKCMENEFRCGNGRCVLRYRVVDGFADCEDESDEISSIPKCNTDVEFRCNDTGRCIPRSWVMDEIGHCNDSSDEVVFPNQVCSNSEFSCRNGRRCLPSALLCDGISHCEDCSDEIEACDEPIMQRCGNDSGNGNAQCILRNAVCTNDSDCPSGPDKFGFKCASSLLVGETCLIPQWSLNDAHPLCQDSSDVCLKSGSFACSRCVANGKVIGKSQVCNGAFDCADLTDECLCESCGKDSIAQKLCNSICYSDKSPACSVCSAGQLHCPDEEKCIELEGICNGVVDCPLSQIDESACGNAGGERCSYGNTDRCYVEMFGKDPISSPEEMIRSPVFVALIWIQAIVAIFGNLAVLHKRAKRWKSYNNYKRSGNIARISMSIANLGVGVMLVVIGSIASQMSGNYCENEVDWRKSTSCKTIGVLTTWFSEVSVFTLVISFSYRLYGYYSAFKAMRQRIRTSISWALLVWVLSLILCCIPFFPGSQRNVVPEVHISPSPYFKGPIIVWDDYRRFNARISILVPQSSSENFSFSAVAPDIVGHFGYYQSNGVCLPKWFSLDEEMPLPTFTVFLLCVNMVCVSMAVVANSLLLFKLATKKIGEQKKKFFQDRANRRQVMALTLSCAYFFCWLGIVVICVIGSRVSAVAYTVATLVLYPLPCALSPLIFTVGFKDIREAAALKLAKSEENNVEFSKKTSDGNGSVAVINVS